MIGPPSASGARLTGDDVQHAVAWHAALRTVVPHTGIESVTVEAADAGNVDDVVIVRAAQPPEYTQVKAAVSAQRAANIDWLTTPSRAGGLSIVQRFLHAGRALRTPAGHPDLVLVTNRSIDPADPILTLRDRNDRLAERLRQATSPGVVTARAALLEHLGCTGDELHELLEHLRLHTDASEAAWRDYHVRDISYAAGVRADSTAFALGINEVRQWVKTSRTEKRAPDIHEAIDRLGLRVQDPYAVLSIKALDEADPPLDPTVVLDWVARFRGSEARNRRGLHNPSEWDSLLRPQLLRAQQRLRSLGAHRVLITGTMRLPTWFAAAVTLQETAGFTPGKIKDGELWVRPAGYVQPAELELSEPVSGLPANTELALALAISCDPTADVQRYLASTGRTMPLLTVSLPGGPSNTSVTGPHHAYAVALAVRDLAREIARKTNPSVLHLFLAAPAGLVVLLGGLWDRVPTTQTYEDLSTAGYEPAFVIPN